MTGEEYMVLLAKRRDEWEAEHMPVRTKQWIRPLLEWFIQPGDERMVTLPAPSAKRVPAPRVLRSAQDLRAERDRIVARIEALSAAASLPEAAAAQGQALGRRRTARHQARTDRLLAKVARLFVRLSRVEGRLARAEAREGVAAAGK